MIPKLSRPRVQDAGEPGRLTADVPLVFCEFFDGAGARLEERVIGHSLVGADEFA